MWYEKESTVNFKSVCVALVLVFLGLLFGIIDYYWTKSSLEDLSGKEVSPSTVIWTMMKTTSNKK